jgi:hypothetical protein
MARMKHTIVATILVLLAVGPAHAGGQPGSIGVGAEFQLSGLGGLSANYDEGKFHAGGFLGLSDPAGINNTVFDIGGRFYYHLAATAMSDFSIGGSLGIRSEYANPGMQNSGRLTAVLLEPGFQIRAFLAANVALSFSGGFSIGAADASGLALTGQVTGAAGVHYYF